MNQDQEEYYEMKAIRTSSALTSIPILVFIILYAIAMLY